MLFAVALRLAHAEEVFAVDAHGEHEYDGDQGIQVVGDGCHEGVEAVIAQIAAYGNRPRGNRRDDAHRRCGGVDDPCQLLVAHAELVGYGAHDRAYGKAVEVVVDEHDQAQDGGHEGGHAGVLDVLGRPFGVRARAAGDGDEHHQRAQQRKEQDKRAVRGNLLGHDLRDIAECGNELVDAGAVQRELVDNKAAEHANQQGGIHLLG